MSDSTLPHFSGDVTHMALRWAARLGSVVSIGLLGMFLFGGQESLNPTLREAAAMAFFPFGVILGMLVAWKHELLGGILSVGSLAALYVVMLALSGRVPTGPWFAIFSSPGIVFLLSGLLSRNSGRPKR